MDQYSDVEEVTKAGVPVFCIYGDKNSGKTALAYKLYQATYGVLSYDDKSFQPLKTVFAQNSTLGENVHVFNAAAKLFRPPRPRIGKQMKKGLKSAGKPLTQGQDRSSEYLISCVKTYEWTQHLIDYFKEKLKPEIPMIDGLEIIQEVCEMTMRADSGFKAFQGIDNYNVWKERNLNLDAILESFKGIATKAIIFTTYSKLQKIVRRGTAVAVEKVPKYISAIMRETDVIIYTYSHYDTKDNIRRFYADVVTSKLPEFPTGKTYDVTGWDYFNIEKEVEPPLGSIPDASVVEGIDTPTDEEADGVVSESQEDSRAFKF